MCEVCHMTPCPAGCPNAAEPPVVYHCYKCDAEIWEGDEFYRIDGVPYCESCIDDAREVAESDPY